MEYITGIKNVSNLIVLWQFASFYNVTESKEYHVFDIGSSDSTSIRLFYTKDAFPVLSKIHYSSKEGDRTIYVKEYRVMSNK